MDQGRFAADDQVGRSDPDQPVILLANSFTAASVTPLRHLLAAHVTAAGLSGHEAEDFVLAVHELVTNAVRHGGGAGQLDLRRHADRLTCAVTDYGRGVPALPAALPDADEPGGRGLWLARELTAALTLTRRPDGLTATVSAPIASKKGGRAADSASTTTG